MGKISALRKYSQCADSRYFYRTEARLVDVLLISMDANEHKCIFYKRLLLIAFENVRRGLQ